MPEQVVNDNVQRDRSISLDAVKLAFDRHQWQVVYYTYVDDSRWGDRYWMIISDPAGVRYTATISDHAASIAPRSEWIPLTERAIRRRSICRRALGGRLIHSVAESIDLLIAEVNEMPVYEDGGRAMVEIPKNAEPEKPAEPPKYERLKFALSVIGLIGLLVVPAVLAAIWLWSSP